MKEFSKDCTTQKKSGRISLIILLCFACYNIYAQNKVIISKDLLLLYVVANDSDTLFVAPIGCGMNYGNKARVGDNMTPEGTYRICQIQDSSAWTHDFKDGYGARSGAYGPWFVRLKIPGFTGIGIHGTCFPNSIGTRCSEGCVRMNNTDRMKLKRYIHVGTMCTILPDCL